ncbi:MAG: arginine--tRNA ligase [Candidatus Thalassarchaeaceae archaeon]|nr:arginine--tRNA ligase [Candidatus Thalassarchaeaceae archaeon]
MRDLIEEVLPVFEIAINKVGIEGNHWKSMLGRSREASQGDISLPCFPFSKQLRLAPDVIAESIVEYIDSSLPSIGEVTASGGYVNIRADIEWLMDRLLSPQEKQSQERILIEHTSANPNGPFHVGRARNAVLGDTFVRMYRAAGQDVTAEYYVDDMGKQVGILCWALENLTIENVESILEKANIETELGPHGDKADHQRVLWYQAANALKEKDPSVDAGVTELIQLSEEADPDVLSRFESAYQPVLDGMLETLARMGISFDSFTKESRFIVDGSVEVLMDSLENSELHGTAENGAHFLELETKGVKGKSTKFFYRRGDGSSLYATRDLAYHQWKWSQANRLLNILGEDHKLQSKQVGIALEELKIKNPDVVFYAFTKLADGKMSTRRGNVVFMDDLLDEAQGRALAVVQEIRSDIEEESLAKISEAVGVSSTRFNIARISPEKGITFRWEDALSLEKDSAPFIMYSHARSCSISRRAGAQLLPTGVDMKVLDETAIALIRRMAKMQDELQNAIQLARPNLFCDWLSGMAGDYNRFYRENHVVVGDEINLQNLLLNELARDHLRRGCDAVGIIPLEEM